MGEFSFNPIWGGGCFEVDHRYGGLPYVPRGDPQVSKSLIALNWIKVAGIGLTFSLFTKENIKSNILKKLYGVPHFAW